jgi:hypothetical protein
LLRADADLDWRRAMIGSRRSGEGEREAGARYERTDRRAY